MTIQEMARIRPHERQLAWQELEFTAFFHYGINTFTNREWGTGKEEPSLYNPASLDTDQWCAAIKAAGIRACILTAKHHDGFCLWDTACTKHSVMSSSKPQDVIALLAASCEKYGLKLGLYLSPWDMHESSYGSGEKYNDFFCSQLEELLTRYGSLYSLWFDGACGEGPNGKKQIYDWDRYYALIRRRQPQAVISIMGPDVRWIGNEAGETRPSEWSVVPSRLFNTDKIAENSQQADNAQFRQQPIQSWDKDLGSRKFLEHEAALIWYPAETDVSIRPGWFYHPEEDGKAKSVETLLHIYETSVGGNSVLLLNIPPGTGGRIHEKDCQRLAELGSAINGIFDMNLLANAQARADSEYPSHPAANILQQGGDYWRPAGERAEIEIWLPRRQRVSHIALQEQIRESQRIEAFSLYAKAVGGWQKIYSGTTVGYKKIARFPPVETDALRISIEQSRIYPTLCFAGAYLES
ncbi:MAG: alpha-L-fucosidase [Treponema sp.]|jgi:alpha-L-fucosidase|nr:alpha-L-fucosidase [Treponema sp.]